MKWVSRVPYLRLCTNQGSILYSCFFRKYLAHRFHPRELSTPTSSASVKLLLLLSGYKREGSISYPCFCRKYLAHRMYPRDLSTPTSSASVKLLLLIFLFPRVAQNHPLAKAHSHSSVAFVVMLYCVCCIDPPSWPCQWVGQQDQWYMQHLLQMS